MNKIVVLIVFLIVSFACVIQVKATDDWLPIKITADSGSYYKDAKIQKDNAGQNNLFYTEYRIYKKPRILHNKFHKAKLKGRKKYKFVIVQKVVVCNSNKYYKVQDAYFDENNKLISKYMYVEPGESIQLKLLGIPANGNESFMRDRFCK